MRNYYSWGLMFVVCVASLLGTKATVGQTEQAGQAERVEQIKPPANPLPDEATSRGVTKFSFIVYGSWAHSWCRRNNRHQVTGASQAIDLAFDIYNMYVL